MKLRLFFRKGIADCNGKHAKYRYLTHVVEVPESIDLDFEQHGVGFAPEVIGGEWLPDEKPEEPNAPAALDVSGFTFTGENTYSCGGQTHSVREYTHDQTGMEFALIPGDSTIEPFLIAKYPCTQAQWKSVMGGFPESQDFEGSYLPVHNVSWDDIMRDDGFADRTGLQLPTEAQWEYACRAGTTTRYYWGDSDSDSTMKRYCWYENNAQESEWSSPHADDEGTQPVGQKLPNAFGLHDMSGNVDEWCEDLYESGSSARGGCWLSTAWYCRSAVRSYRTPDFRRNNLGFRPVFNF